MYLSLLGNICMLLRSPIPWLLHSRSVGAASVRWLPHSDRARPRDVKAGTSWHGGAVSRPQLRVSTHVGQHRAQLKGSGLACKGSALLWIMILVHENGRPAGLQ